MQAINETRQPVMTPAAALVGSDWTSVPPTPQHTTAEWFSEDVAARWPELLADAEQFPTVTCCANCGGTDVHAAESDEGAGVYCPQCAYVEPDADERNDLREALAIAGTEEYWCRCKIERRHLLALVSHCLWLMEVRQ